MRCFRMTLLLGPPGSGKTILLKALAGKLEKDLRVCDFVLLFHNIFLRRLHCSKVTIYVAFNV